MKGVLKRAVVICAHEMLCQRNYRRISVKNLVPITPDSADVVWKHLRQVPGTSPDGSSGDVSARRLGNLRRFVLETSEPHAWELFGDHFWRGLGQTFGKPLENTSGNISARHLGALRRALLERSQPDGWEASGDHSWRRLRQTSGKPRRTALEIPQPDAWELS